jgi:hypothetical protein
VAVPGSSTAVQGCVCVCVGAVGVCTQTHARCSAICRRGTRMSQAATSRRRAWSPWPRRDDGSGGMAKVVWLVARLGTGRVGFVRVCAHAISWYPRVAARHRQGGTAAVSRPRLGLDRRLGCVRTRVSPGILGLWRGRAVRGALTFLAHCTTRRRRGNGGCRVQRRRDGSLHKIGARPDGERGS